jgi:hypothetical protein
VEPEPLLSDLSAVERLDVWIQLLNEQESSEARSRMDDSVVSWEEGPDGARVYVQGAGRRLEITPGIIRELADELHVDLAPLIERALDDRRREDNPGWSP